MNKSQFNEEEVEYGEGDKPSKRLPLSEEVNRSVTCPTEDVTMRKLSTLDEGVEYNEGDKPSKQRA